MEKIPWRSRVGRDVELWINDFMQNTNRADAEMMESLTAWLRLPRPIQSLIWPEPTRNISDAYNTRIWERRMHSDVYVTIRLELSISRNH